MASRIIYIFAVVALVSISPSLCVKLEVVHNLPELKYYNLTEIIDNLRNLSSITENSTESWKIIKPHLTKFENADPKTVAGVVIELAKTRGNEIHEQINRLHRDSKNNELKGKYLSCSKNYNDAIRNLIIAKINLEAGDYGNIPIQIDDAIEELGSCGLQFGGDSFDPAHIRNRVREFRDYVNIVKAAVDHLLN